MGTMGMYYFQRIIISDGDSTSQAPAPTYSTAFKERPNHQYLGTQDISLWVMFQIHTVT